MTVKEVDFINSYIEWLRTKIHINEINGYYEISTPFLDRHNDHLHIYVKQEGEKIVITDDGYIIGDLLMTGCDISSQRRKSVMEVILNSLGVKLVEDSLMVEARPENYPQKKHNLIQAMLSINDMFMLSKSRVASVFLEDVEQYLDINEIRYTPNVQLIGKSGFSHNFDFVIPSSRNKPERFIRAINNPTKDKAQTILFAWSDIREVRKREASMYVFLNDVEKSVRFEILSAFTLYEIKPILWSRRQDSINELSA
ncbi:MAG: DUF1829 domain-containing protein [Clostridia bacterium]|jgi:hypothetical protein